MTITTITEFPRKTKEIENLWITLSDGCQLAARIWLPEDAKHEIRCPPCSNTSPIASATGHSCAMR